MTLCSNELLSLIGGIAVSHTHVYRDAEHAARDLYLQNAVANGGVPNPPQFEYHPVSRENYTLDQLKALIIHYTRNSEGNPTWEKSPAKQATDAILADITKAEYLNIPDPRITLKTITPCSPDRVLTP